MYVNVGKTIIHHLPVITIFCLVGFVETILSGWCVCGIDLST